MSENSYSRPFGYGVVAAGFALAFVSAVVPFHEAGYRLMFGVFVAGLTPYLLYGLVVALLRHVMTTVAGAVLLLVHGGLVVVKRFLAQADYADGLIYVVPMLLTALLIPLFVRALREPWHD